MSSKLKIALFFCLLAMQLPAFRFPPPHGVKGNGMRMNFGASLGFYTINTNHAQGPSARMSGLFGLKKEIRLDKESRVFFLAGADYFFHGLNFRSYYFRPDSVKLYHKNFSYDYRVFLHEINVPLQFKYSFTRENNSLFSPYVMIGYHLRYMLPGRVTVSYEGNAESDVWEKFRFRTPFLNPQMNTFLSFTAGWQKNTINNSRSGFFIEGSFRYGITQYLFDADYAPSSLYINGMHAMLLMGVKF